MTINEAMLAVSNAVKINIPPLKSRQPALPPLDSDDLLDAMEKDKKATQSGLMWVLPMRPGDVDLVSDLPRAEVRSEIDAFLRESRA